MAVYVDDMHLTQMGQFGRMKMCHMIADTDHELHAMAARIGVDRCWWQSPEKTSGSHYDIAMRKRALAVSYGAVEITMRQCAALNFRRKVLGVLGAPEDAEAWMLEWSRNRSAESGVLNANND